MDQGSTGHLVPCTDPPVPGHRLCQRHLDAVLPVVEHFGWNLPKGEKGKRFGVNNAARNRTRPMQDRKPDTKGRQKPPKCGMKYCDNPRMQGSKYCYACEEETEAVEV